MDLPIDNPSDAVEQEAQRKGSIVAFVLKTRAVLRRDGDELHIAVLGLVHVEAVDDGLDGIWVDDLVHVENDVFLFHVLDLFHLVLGVLPEEVVALREDFSETFCLGQLRGLFTLLFH